MWRKKLHKPVRKFVEKRFSERRTNLAGNNSEIHPIYEAVVALLIKCVSDEEAKKRLLKGDEESVKSILIVDKLLEVLKDNSQKQQLRTMLSSGQSLDAIIEKSALYLSEGKRTDGGDVLYRIDALQPKQRRYLIRKIRRIRRKYPLGVYIKTDVFDYINKNAGKFRKCLYNHLIKKQ